MHPWMFYILLLSLPVRIFLGLVGKAVSPSVVFTPALWRGSHLTIGFVDFYQVSFQHLGILAKTWGLRSVLKISSFWSSLVYIFLEEAPKLSAKYISCQFLRMMLRFSFHFIFLAVSSLVVWLSALSELDCLLRALLHSWGYLWWFNVSDVFR